MKPFFQDCASGWDDPDLLSEYGFALTQLSQLEEAKKVYQRWSELNTDQARPLYCLGYVYYLEENWQEAIFYFEQALRIYPDYFICLYRLAYALFQYRKPRRALRCLEQLKAIYQKKEDQDWLRRNKKTWVRSLFLSGKSYYVIKEYQQALQDFQQVVEIDQKNYIVLEFKWYEIAKTLVALKRYQEALHHLQQALNQRFPQPYILDLKGQVLTQMNKYSEAIETFTQALQKRKFAYILLHRARTYIAMGNFSEAAKDLHEALKRDKKGRHKIYLELGKLSQRQKRLSEAQHYFKQAIQYKQKIYGSDFAEAHYAMALCYLETNDTDSAKESLAKALSANPNLEWDTTLRNLMETKQSTSLDSIKQF